MRCGERLIFLLPFLLVSTIERLLFVEIWMHARRCSSYGEIGCNLFQYVHARVHSKMFVIFINGKITICQKLFSVSAARNVLHSRHVKYERLFMIVF